MNNIKAIFLAFSLLLIPVLLSAQEYFPFKQIKKFTTQQPPGKLDSSFSVLTNRLGAELHYLYPFYQGIGWENKFKEKIGPVGFYTSFAEALAFAGDYNMASAYVEKSFTPIPDSVQTEMQQRVNELAGIQYVSARQSIAEVARHYKTIMINESHASGQHRAFTYSLLADLYKAGFRYFAMEALNNYSNKCLDSLNVFTGYYTCEPVAGELVRHALQLGYKLISYEDTLAYKSPHLSARDSVQALNIYNSIRHDKEARVLIHAGYTHVAKKNINDFIPMAVWFSRLTGQVPFTIDQTEMTEGSQHEFGKIFYGHFTRRFVIHEPSFLFHNKRPFNPSGLDGYDAIVCHPPVKNIHNRPAWLNFNNERQPVLIAPSERNLFFVQAFYRNEYSEEMKNFIVPADQTYIPAPNGYYCLFLKKGAYKIILRDAGYKILAEKEIDVL